MLVLIVDENFKLISIHAPIGVMCVCHAESTVQVHSVASEFGLRQKIWTRLFFHVVPIIMGNPLESQEMQEVQEKIASNDVHIEAGKVISSAVKWSAAAAIIPVPLVDLAALGAVQLKMVRDLARVYGFDARSETLRGVISALLGTLAPAAVSGSLLGSSLKSVPIGGTILGGLSLAAFGSAATYAMGKIFVRHFEKGGTLDSFSADAVTEDLKREFATARAKA